MNKGQRELKKFITSKNRLPNNDEIFDLYTDYVMRQSRACKWSVNGPMHEDYVLWEIQDRSRLWCRNALGSLVLQGHFRLLTVIE